MYLLSHYEDILFYEELLLLAFGIFFHHLWNCIHTGPHITTALSLLCLCLKMPLTFLTYLGFGNESMIDSMATQIHSLCIDLSLTS